MRRGRIAAVACIAIGALCSACAGAGFVCMQDADCASPGGGQCIDDHCAFPDDDCESGLEFGKHSGDLAGQCVPPSGESVATGGETLAEGDSGASTLPSTDEADTATVADESDVSTAGPLSGEVEFRDDELALEFGAGSFVGVEYANGRLRLATGETSGTFTSRVFDAGAPVEWATLRWQPDAPYAKPLLDDAMAEEGYAEGNVDMVDNVVLFHFDAMGMLGPDTEIVDASGRANDGVIVGTNGSSSGVAGVFGVAMADELDAYVSIPAGAMDLDFGGGDFTWATWFRFAHECATNNVFMGVDDVIGGGDAFPHLWLGCTSGAWPECPRDDTMPRPAGVLLSEHDNATDGVSFCGAGPIATGEWRHLALTKSGHDEAMVRLYVDGAMTLEVPATFVSPLDLTQEGDFGFGGFSGATYPTEVDLDDAAIWTRALDELEVAALFRRGALRLEVALRVCHQAECADDPPFVGGSDLEAGVVFTDPQDAAGPGTDIPVAGIPQGRWAQYRLAFVGPADGPTPALELVALRGVFAQ